MSEQPLLVTGGAGFIGANFVHHLVSRGSHVVTLDALTYAGNRASLAALDHDDRHTFVEGSICDRGLLGRLFDEHRPRAVINFAAESHVDRSIDGPAAFIDTNVVGVFELLEAARIHHNKSSAKADGEFRFLHVSTDEVYGSIAEGAFTETSPYAPSSPYAASKAAADHLVRAWHRTYDLPAVITNCSNNYGPYQFPEKLIPLMIAKALEEEPLPVYGDGQQVRDWVHVADHCRALDMVLSDGVLGETYNVGGGAEHANLNVVERLSAILDRLRPRSGGGSYAELIEHVADRPGHDVRYAIDATKINDALGWRPEIDFDDGLEQTVRWYLDNTDWSKSARASYGGERLGRADGRAA